MLDPIDWASWHELEESLRMKNDFYYVKMKVYKILSVLFLALVTPYLASSTWVEYVLLYAIVTPTEHVPGKLRNLRALTIKAS